MNQREIVLGKGAIMKAAFVVTWSTPVPGREKKAIEYFREVNDFFAKLAAEGKCTEPEYFLAPHGPHFWFVKGEFETLAGLQALPKVQEFIFQGRYLNTGFDYGFYLVGTDENLKFFEDAGVKLGFI